MSYHHYITVSEGYETTYFCGWDKKGEPVLEYCDLETAFMDIEEATEDYQKLEEMGFDAEIETCWTPAEKVMQGGKE